MRNPGPHVWVAVLVALCLAGCASIPSLPLASGGEPIPAGEPAYRTTVQVRYLAAGGVLIQRGPDSIVTAPFFSNPSLIRVALGRVETNAQAVDHVLRPIADALRDSRAILVGHSHYDHLMDVPYIKQAYMRDARVYGSDTAKNILAAYPDLLPADVVSVENDLGDAHRSGGWWYVTPRLRFMALRSEHAAVLLHHKFAPGTYERPLERTPSSASDWREGQTLAYLIEFLDDGGRVDFRIHYQDAGSTPPLGFPPDDEVAAGSRTDLAILCMPGFDQVDDYPEAIVRRLNPRFVLGIHWENFFEPIPDDPRDLHLVPAFDAARFVARLTKALAPDAKFIVAAPGTWLQFPK
jgi:L-ascorbate metabolism protein UlaG (beta-lactamase superfamily)